MYLQVKEREVIKMNKVYDYRIGYRMEGEKNFLDTRIWKYLQYLPEENAKDETIIISSFEQLVSLVECGCEYIPNATIKTFFGKVYAVELSNGMMTYSEIITKKRFKPIEIRGRYIEENNLSIEQLKSYLTADDFIKFLKDRGITKF